MTLSELTALRELCEKASPGPWEREGDFIFMGNLKSFFLDEIILDADANFIAAAREALPKLLDEVERQRQLLRDSRCALDMDYVGPTIKIPHLLEEIDKALGPDPRRNSHAKAS